MKTIAYYRVSTKKQEASGLGLEAQRTMVTKTFGKPTFEFTEIESGKLNKRPQLALAIQKAKTEDALLVIARLDRLSRNVAFIANLMESNVKFKCADFPEMDNLTIHIFAALAQKERELIAIRTKQALAEKKKQGIKLGCPEITASGKTRNEILAENRSKRTYDKPDADKLDSIKSLADKGLSKKEILPIARQILQKDISLPTLYRYFNS